MSKTLVIVESPAKAKTINKYLGNQYIVRSSVGHIRDLPQSGGTANKKTGAEKIDKSLSKEQKEQLKQQKSWNALISRMGIDPENGWNPHYEIMPGKEKVVAELSKLAKTVDSVYLATDLDREGEAIAWHLKESISDKNIEYKRVVFNEITKNAIQEAFNTPGELNMNQVNAQQTRRFLDRVVGYMVSPLLWKKIARGLSAGRVQSVAVRLVVEREMEISAFQPEEYWEVFADLATPKGTDFRAQVCKHLVDGKLSTFKPKNKQQCDQALNELNAATYQLTAKETKATSSKPRAPFITSTLQQAASTQLGFGVKKTMMLAQRLYEAGHITYMRTDSTHLSQDAIAQIRDHILDNFGQKYLPVQPRSYSSKASAQEAHEAIRPSDVHRLSELLHDMESDAKRLYQLIRNQALSCQMTDARYENTQLTITAGNYELRAKGRTLIFDGWTKVRRQSDQNADVLLPEVQSGDALKTKKIDPMQHFTKPPARFSEASLVKELEKLGIGRPSTYASIISTIQDRGYVSIQKKRFYAEKIGEIVVNRLSESFQHLMNYSFTAEMEEKLDQIAQGQIHWQQTLDDFYLDFKQQLSKADSDLPDAMRPNAPAMTDIGCPECSRPMNIRVGSTGVFLGCSGYSLPPKERCKGTLNLISGDEAVDVEQDEESEAKALLEKKRCPKCDKSMHPYLIDEHRKLHICANSPDCDGFVVEQGQFRIKGYDGPTIECDKCGSEMQLLSGRFGKYFGCSNKECSNTRKLLSNGEAAPPKADPVHMPELACKKSDGYFILRDGAAGLFMASSKFPRSRETRAPKVSELKAHKDELDAKFLYLCDAPEVDNKNNPVLIRFSRKNKQQYLMSEDKNGKATGWLAYYKEGQWDITIPAKKTTRKKTPAKRKTS